MDQKDFVEANEDLLYDNFLQEHYNHCDDYPDHVNQDLLYNFEAEEYYIAKDKLATIGTKRPSTVRRIANNKLLNSIVRKDSSYLDGVIV